MAGSIPSHIKSISIPLMDNHTSEFGISEDITDYVIQEFNESGVLSITDLKHAQSILKGSIKNIDEGPYTYSKKESVSEYRYKVDIKVEWYDVKNNKNLIENTYSAFGAYGSMIEANATFAGERTSIPSVSSKILPAAIAFTLL